MSEITTLHDPFARYLREQGIMFIRARSDRESTIAEGCQDFTLLRSNSTLCVEFKTKEGKLSPAQREWHERMAATGTKVHVIRDLSQAIELVTAWQGTLGAVQSIDAPRPKQRKVGRALYEERDGELIKIRNLEPGE